MTDIPHFDLPFRYRGGKAVEVEQGTLRDIQNCVEAILRTHVGTREGEPEFGIPDLAFQRMPIDRGQLHAAILLLEPRANDILEHEPEDFNNFIDRVKIRIESPPPDTEAKTEEQ